MGRFLIIATHARGLRMKRVSKSKSSIPGSALLTLNIAAQLGATLPASLPVLFVYGVHDGTCPQKFVKRMPSLIPNLKIVALQNKGHWILLEAKDETTREVLEFLDGLLPPPRTVGEAKL
jgi:pimeloyl-ACP methyl ester carboxylesterase